MTHEEKDLLLKDLCARLPYRVIIKSVGENKIIGLWDLRDIDNLPIPYLRPMSSMTEEERNEYNEYLFYGSSIGLSSNTATAYELIDWLNKKMFDYLGLIPKGLAIEVTESNNPYND